MGEPNFQSALEKGIAAARKAEENRSEIQLVIDALSADVERRTDGKVRIAIDQRTEPAGLFDNPLARRRGYSVLVAYKNQPSDGSELARYKEDPSAYPVTLNWRGAEVHCGNKGDLEEALMDLLSDPDTGKKILKLMRST